MERMEERICGEGKGGEGKDGEGRMGKGGKGRGAEIVYKEGKLGERVNCVILKILLERPWSWTLANFDAYQRPFRRPYRGLSVVKLF